jgi:glycine/D-amino acid oxidase-like deaminating enzyme/nitrite reductase/ring-hydroxylating ferredoxin subunit
MTQATNGHGSGSTTSPWMDVEVPVRGVDDTTTPVDVCVVGAGIAGLSAAYLLAREGKRVVVLDDGPVGGGETSRTTAHLASYLDDRFQVLESLHGAEGARLAAESHAAAIDRIEAICQEEGIDCDFRRVDGFLFLGPETSDDFLEKELAAALRAGLLDAEVVHRAPIPGFDTGPALRFPRQGQFHPMKYLKGLAAASERRGGRIFTGVHAAEIEDGERPYVTTSTRARIEAGSVVVATNAAVNSRFAIPTRQGAYRSYVVALVVPRDVIPVALYWDTSDPYHYVRLLAGSGTMTTDLLIVGGEDHKVGQADDADARFMRLEAWARERFPGIAAVAARWSGQIMEPVDGLAFIGPAPGAGKNVYVVTGDSGHGMTHGTLGGILVADLIAGRDNAWSKIYDPGRSTLRSAKELVKENVNAALQYGDWLKPGDVGSADDIQPGEGALVRRGAHIVAVFKDEGGTCHERSAVCPHLGGIVAWNGGEKSWDCPCHGSRFDAYGKVVNGPANSDLARLDEADDPASAGVQRAPRRTAEAPPSSRNH